MNIPHNKDFLELLIDTIPNPVFYKNKDGIYEHCNQEFAQIILGIPKEKIVGKSLFDIPEYIPLELAKIYKEKDDALFKNPGKQVYEADVKCSDNIVRKFRFHKAVLFDEDKNILGLVGVMLDITEAFENQKLLDEKNKELEDISYKDPLTNIYNRRMFDEVFSKLLSASKRAKRVFNFLLLDVDDFKLYNDNFGHIKGDQALQSVAKAIKDNLMREDDMCFRIGGEEFTALYSTKDIKSANKIAKNICNTINELNIEHITENKVLTASIGLISISSTYDDNLDFYYKRVDKLLYKAKDNGKNQVIQEEL